ncbi:hypothetical protein ASD62_14630 [Phycicoccus sp. Root563]|uniref:right-handed parallel beta-helix repeat-containing protein n=1 Tax=Phycicoccus sp. Root563 TaxID=1736562 RepID=UPI00070361AB|nr:right-handed parallel beta-helix repeat-containing protein [Phycicoccus sp. Root563]KQZ90339.1 hypothetical protein ASD62_14630 [Phycicoccus sp. Root563]
MNDTSSTSPTASPRTTDRTPRRSGRVGLVAAVTLALVAGITPWSPSGDQPSASAATSPRKADASGSVGVGVAHYPVPSGSVFVSPSGNDAAAGTLSRPVRTIARGLALAPSGGTVVLRGGTYHESVTITRSVTLQNYPHEAAWLDGSVPVSGWTKVGSVWRHSGWTPRFDASPTYTKGAPDGTAPGWQFVNAAYPMAAHPDMVFRNGVSQRQVKSLSLVKEGTFYLDTKTSQLYVGSDPSGASMRGTDIAKAMSVRAPNVLIRGFGIRRFGNSVWHMGAVTLESPRIALANVVIDQMATTGVAAITSDILLNRVTVTNSGLLGVHAATADRFRVLYSRITGNNAERFNTAPVSGGIKVGRLRTITVADTTISDNYGHGFWADQSVYDMRLVRNNVVGNQGTGVFLEISSLAAVVDNLISNNTGNGIKVNNTSNVRIWNNTVVGNSRQLNIVQDSRLASNTSWGHDPRRPNPDPTMTWVLGPVQIRNNVIGLSKGGNCLTCVEDYTFKRSAAQIGVTSAGNIFNRTSTSTPTWTHVWSSGKVNPYVYTALAPFQKSTGQDRSSVAYDTSAVVTLGGRLSSAAATKGAAIAVALPADLAALSGHPTGARKVGVWGR